MMTIYNIKEYKWGLLWESLNSTDQSSLNSSQKLLKAFILGYWWKDLEASKKTLFAIDQKNAEYYWVLLMVELANGIYNNFVQYIKKCELLQLDQDFRNWAMIDFCGRTNEYERQIKFLQNSIQSTNLGWPFIAYIHSLEKQTLSSLILTKLINIEETTVSDKIEKLLFKIFILDHLKEYNEIERVITLLIDNCNDQQLLSLLSFSIYKNNSKKNHFADHLILLDLMSQVSYMNFDSIIEWLQESTSSELNSAQTKQRINRALQIVPKELEYQGAVVTFGLIYFWIKGDMININEIIKAFNIYGNLEIKKKNWLQVFFNFIRTIHSFKNNNLELYLTKEDNNIERETLYVVGESNSLPLNLVPITVANKQYKAATCLILGVKMFHLNENDNNRYKEAFKKKLNALKGKSVLFTIGEIDCRPNEGLWHVYKKTKFNLDELVFETVNSFINYIESEIKSNKIKKVIIQGVPNRKYNLDGTLLKKEPLQNGFNKDELEEYLEMIKKVNIYLEKLAISKQWYFLDIYTASIDSDIYIDSTHIKPSFYKDIGKYLKTP